MQRPTEDQPSGGCLLIHKTVCLIHNLLQHQGRSFRRNIPRLLQTTAAGSTSGKISSSNSTAKAHFAVVHCQPVAACVRLCACIPACRKFSPSAHALQETSSPPAAKAECSAACQTARQLTCCRTSVCTASEHSATSLGLCCITDCHKPVYLRLLHRSASKLTCCRSSSSTSSMVMMPMGSPRSAPVVLPEGLLVPVPAAGEQQQVTPS